MTYTRRHVFQAAVAAPLASLVAASDPPKRLRFMGSAGPGLGARIRATTQTGKQWDIVEYCHSKGLGAAHTSLPRDLNPAGMKKIRDQVNQWDMRLTIGLRTPRAAADLPQYEAAVKACSEFELNANVYPAQLMIRLRS